jgi:hypothetical protein
MYRLHRARLAGPALILACGGAPAPTGEVVFLRGGVVLPGEADGQPLPGGQGTLVAAPWSPLHAIEVAGRRLTAPEKADCLTLFRVELGDVSRLLAMGGDAPDTALAWSPTGDRLAVGSYNGDLLVLDGWTGAVKARRHLAETMVKTVAWAPDGDTLYAGEQSPDAFVHALDPRDLEPRWSYRLADLIDSSPAPPGEDIYGVYTLPSAYGISVLSGGDLILAGTHGWNDSAGVRKNKAVLLRLDDRGQLKARWPAEAADATLWHPRVDEAGGLVIVAVGRSADGPAPVDLPVNGAQVLRLDDLSPVSAHQIEPLAPWWKSAFLWEALDVSAANDAVLMGFGDGRLRLQRLGSGAALASVDAGTPVMAGQVPIAASIGHGLLHGDEAVFLTSGTNIPYGAAAPDTRPPAAHPNEDGLWVYGLDGAQRWSWHGEQRVEGLSLGADGQSLAVGAGARDADTRRDLYGALIFDLSSPGDGRGGEARRLTTCSTEGPVFFRQALSADGRLALAEFPYRTEAGSVGAYRVTVMR